MNVTDGPVPRRLGACCSASGACTITTEAGVRSPNVWQGTDTNCNPNPCPNRRRSLARQVPCSRASLICQDNYVDNYNGGCNSTPVIWQTLSPQADDCATVCGRSCTYDLYGASNRDTDWYLTAGCTGPVTYTMFADFPFMMALFTGVDCGGLVYTYYIGDAGGTGTLFANIADMQEVGFFAANSGFSGWPLEGTYILNVCGMCCPPDLGACCDAAGVCTVVTPEVCAFSGGTFQGDPTCEPTTCTPVATESTSWGAIKARFLQPDAQPVGGAGRPGSGAPARVTSRPTPSPTVTTRSAGGSIPELLGTTRPPKPGSSGMRAGQ